MLAMRTMVIRVPELTGYGGIRRVAVSVPYAAQLIDGAKYMLPGDVKPPEGDTELRRHRAPRGPTLRSLVRLALKCESAEELGRRLKRRYEQQQRRGTAGPGRRRGPNSTTSSARRSARMCTTRSQQRAPNANQPSAGANPVLANGG